MFTNEATCFVVMLSQITKYPSRNPSLVWDHIGSYVIICPSLLFGGQIRGISFSGERITPPCPPQDKGLPAPRPFRGANGGVVAVGADLRQPLTALPEEMEGEIPAVSATSLGMPFFLPGPL